MNLSSNRSPLPIDSDLINKLILGQLDAFKKIYALHFKRVFHFTHRFSLSVEDAEEITQDVFVKLWQKRNLIDEERSFSNFLYTIAQNLVIDKMRQHVSYEKNCAC
ncbi:MAG: sigma factor [Cyclobacteriaceae bacterium]|nr:sigma factor [Cyclobacteriaceae bacterium]